jgi:hypothetical protein
VDDQGRSKDSITRIGSWGGFSRHRLGFYYWNRYKNAPSYIGTIKIAGGHPHYFSSKPPYVHQGKETNLSRTLDSVWEWLRQLPENRGLWV